MTYTIFGESHGPAIGVVLSDVPPGIPVDEAYIARELGRRAPGRNDLSTARREADRAEILSGVFQGRTTGTPLGILIRNVDQHSSDYDVLREKARPSHADLPASVRYGGFQDHRGGGHFSGRLTAPLVAAGAVAKLYLREKGILVGAHIASIGGIPDDPMDMAEPPMETLAYWNETDFPTLNRAAGQAMQDKIRQCRTEGDSVGGTVACAVTGLPMGLGQPDLDRNGETIFARHLFAVPAVKGLEFGSGFRLSEMRGSRANDPWIPGPKTETNHNGGLLGGITTGMPLVFRVAFKPTPSISLPQKTVSMVTGEETVLELGGRHDPCVVHRAVPVVEAAAALAAAELLEGGRRG